MLAMVVSGGLFAYTYTNAAATLTPVAAKAEFATVASAAGQPAWDYIIAGEAETEILRPNAAGDEARIAIQFPVSGEHWDKVAEESSDGDSTYVATSTTEWEEDLYNIADSTGSGTIYYVRVYMEVRSEDTPTQSSVYAHIKTGGIEYNGTEEMVTTSYAVYSYQWDFNPQTLADWTWDEIDALQIGVGLRDAAKKDETLCTQVYAEVDYTTIQLSGDVPIGNLFDITPEATYTGDLLAKVYLTNTAALTKAYQYLNIKLYLDGSVEAGEDPNYRLLTLENGVATFNLKDYSSGGSYTLSVTGGSYCLVSTDTSQWDPDYEIEPEFYCEVTQSG